MGKLIAICGPDKVGKETQSKLLVEHLKQRGLKATRVEVPINDKFTYKVIYWMLRNKLAFTMPNVFQWLQYVNKRIFQETRLADLMAENDVVVLDRWALSSIVYGACGGADPRKTAILCARLRKPDLTIVLHGKPLIDRKDDAYEADLLMQEQVRNAYKDWAQMHDDCVLLNNEGGRSIVHSKIVAILCHRGLI